MLPTTIHHTFTIDVATIDTLTDDLETLLKMSKIGTNDDILCHANLFRFSDVNGDYLIINGDIQLIRKNDVDIIMEIRLINKNPKNSARNVTNLAVNQGIAVIHTPIYEFDQLISSDNGFITDNKVIIELYLSIVPVNVLTMKSDLFMESMNTTNCIVFMEDGVQFYVNYELICDKSANIHENVTFDKNDGYYHKTIDNTDKYDMLAFLMLIHNTGIPLFDHTVPSALNLAVKYQCPVEIQQCEKYILESKGISKSDKLKYAEEYKLDRLKAYCQSPSTVEEYVIHGKVRDFDKPTDKTDITLIVEGDKLYACKQILRYESKVWDKELPAKKIYHIDNTDKTSFLSFLRMIYQPTDMITASNLQSMLKLAQRYQVDFILGKCQDYLITTTDITDKLIYADKYQLDMLMNHCKTELRSKKDLEKLRNVPDNIIKMITDNIDKKPDPEPTFMDLYQLMMSQPSLETKTAFINYVRTRENEQLV